MKKIKIVTVIGNRPKFIKATVISRAIRLHNNNHEGHRIQEILVHTGQHYDVNMSEIFFKEMRIPEPDYNLGICNCSHGAMTGRMLEQIEAILLKEKPHVVMVYGDTNSTLAGGLAAAKLHYPVAHVEAGLRSFNMSMPEEINRVLTDHVARFLFCPTDTAIKNLSVEGILQKNALSSDSPVIVKTGDVMYDAALFYAKVAKPTKKTEQLLKNLHDKYYLATVHRAENTDNLNRLRNIVEAFSLISISTPVVLPLHPRTNKIIEENGLRTTGIKIIEPVGYFDMLILLEKSKAVFTDSGGLQKEAYFFQKPCKILRDETEWVELVKHGFSELVDADKDAIVNAEKNIGIRNNEYNKELFGDGDAGDKIIHILTRHII